MRNSSKKLLIIGFLFILCLFAFYKVTKYYASKDIKPIIKDSANVNVADINGYPDVCYVKRMANCRGGNWGCGYNYNAYKNISSSYECLKKYQINCSNGCNQAKICDYVNTNMCTINVNVNQIDVTTGDKFGFTFEALNCHGDVTVTYENGKQERLAFATKSDNKVTGSGTVIASSKTCAPVVVTVSTPCGSNSAYANVQNEWTSSKVDCELNPSYTWKFAAEKNGASEYYADPDPTTGCYKTKWSRSCGNSSGGGGEKPACYADAKVLSLATSTFWGKSSDAPVSMKNNKISNIKSEAECKVQKDPTYCKPTSKACVKEDKNASSCEEDLTLKYNDGLSCDGKAFYNINCENVSTVKFDSGDDGEEKELSLYKGQGFKYGITITTKKTCTATFNKDNWTNAYNTINKKINQANSDLKSVSGNGKEDVQKEINRLKNIQNELKELISSYNNYNFISSNNEASTIQLKYKINKKESTDISNFQTTVIAEGKGDYSNKSVVNLGVSGVSNPYNYTWSNKNNPRKVKLILPKVYIDELTGKITNVTKNAIDGGNKLYLDYNADVGTAIMNVKVSGVGCNSDVNNDKCSIKIKKQDILYRPIDVSNPFINSEWTPGVNWVNSKFDFRSVIHSDIWSK